MHMMRDTYGRERLQPTGFMGASHHAALQGNPDHSRHMKTSNYCVCGPRKRTHDYLCGSGHLEPLPMHQVLSVQCAHKNPMSLAVTLWHACWIRNTRVYQADSEVFLCGREGWVAWVWAASARTQRTTHTRACEGPTTGLATRNLFRRSVHCFASQNSCVTVVTVSVVQTLLEMGGEHAGLVCRASCRVQGRGGHHNTVEQQAAKGSTSPGIPRRSLIPVLVRPKQA